MLLKIVLKRLVPPTPNDALVAVPFLQLLPSRDYTHDYLICCLLPVGSCDLVPPLLIFCLPPSLSINLLL